MSARLACELAEIASELDVMADREDVDTGDIHGKLTISASARTSCALVSVRP